jgi:hypothetical protein
MFTGYLLLKLAQLVPPIFLVYINGLETLQVAKKQKVLYVEELAVNIIIQQ